MGIGLESIDVSAWYDQVKEWADQVRTFWDHGGNEGNYSAEYHAMYPAGSKFNKGAILVTDESKSSIEVLAGTNGDEGALQYRLISGPNLVVGDHLWPKGESAPTCTIRSAPTKPFSGKIKELVDKVDNDKTTALQAELSRRAQQAAAARKPLSDTNDVRIGLTVLTVPPENIRINEVRFNDSIPGLRTSSSALVKSGRGQIRIDLDLTFPNLTAINLELREIVAQFRATPFLPVESRYIFNAILASAGKVPPQVIQLLSSKIDQEIEKYTNIVSQMINLIFGSGQGALESRRIGCLKWDLDPTKIDSDQSEIARLRAVFEGMNPQEIYNEWKGWVGVWFDHKYQGTVPSEAWNDTIMGTTQSSQALTNIGLELRELAVASEVILNNIRDTHQEALQEKAAQTNYRPIVPCILHSLQVQTVSGETNSLQARLSLLYWSYEAYIPDLLFKNEFGGPTLEITECPFFREYLDKTFLRDAIQGGQLGDDSDPGDVYLGLFRHESGTRLSFEYPTTKFRKVEDGENSNPLGPTIPAAQLFGGKAANMTGYDSKGDLYKSVPETLEIAADDENIIVQHIMLQIQNRVAMQPIQGAMYGTAQHLGAMNARVAIVLSVVGSSPDEHDAAMGRIQRMKLETEKVSLALGGRARRNNKIAVRNDVLSLCGIRNVQIDGVSTRTVPGETNSSVVRLDMTEYSVSQDLREKLKLAQPELQTSLEEAALQYGVELSAAYRSTDESNSDAKRVVTESDAGSFCTVSLFGDGDRQGIISLALLATYLKGRPEILSKLKDAPEFAEKPYTVGRKFDADGNPFHVDEHGNRWRQAWGGVTFDGVEPGVAEWNAIPRAPRDADSDFVSRATGFVTGVGDKYLPTGESQKDPSIDPLEASARQLAWEMIHHWRALKSKPEKGKEPEPGTVAMIVEDSRKIVTIDPTPESYLKDLIKLMHRQAFFIEQSRLRVFSEIMRDQFRPLREYVQSRINDYRKVSNYPDMHLPTYNDMFLSEEAVFGDRSTSKSLVGRLQAEYSRRNGIAPQTREFLSRFMPTWRDLGKPAPVDGDPYDLAKDFNDFIPPDFFYYHIKLGPMYDSFAKQVQSEADDIYNSSGEEPLVRRRGGSIRKKDDVARANRMQGVRSSFDNVDIRYISNPDGTHLARKSLDMKPDPSALYPQFAYHGGAISMTSTPSGYGTDPSDIYTSALPDYQQIIGKFTHDRPQHLKSLFRESWEQRRDNMFRMLRAFPTFRLYFIELDNEEWGFWDDFYSYNAVADIKLSQHKFEPDLLEILIINTTGNLDQMRSSIEDPDRTEEDARWRKAEGGDPRRPINQGGSRIDVDTEYGTGEPRSLDKFFLQIGTQIKLKIGYGADPDDLTDKFTGQIVEIEPGDVIRVVAQSYKAELAVPLNTYKSGHDSDPRDVLEWVMDNSPTSHFGNWSPYESGLLAGTARDGSQLHAGDNINEVGFLGYRRDEGKQKFRDHIAGSTAARASTALVHAPSRLSLAQSIFGIGTPTSLLASVPIDDTTLQIAKSALGYGSPGSLMVSMLTSGKAMFAPLGTLSLSEFRNLAESALYRLLTLRGTRKLENVFMPRHNWLREWFSWGREFIIPDRTGLEVLHELTRQMPGYVFDVRPYDHNATLFFGKPEQRYIYTSARRDEERKWLKLRQSATKDVQGSFVELFKKFSQSREFGWWKDWIADSGSDEVNSIYRKARTTGQAEGARLLAPYTVSNATLGLAGDDRRREGERKMIKGVEVNRWSPYDATQHLNSVTDVFGLQTLKLLAITFFNRYANIDRDWAEQDYANNRLAVNLLDSMLAEYIGQDPDEPIDLSRAESYTDPETGIETTKTVADLQEDAKEWTSRDETTFGWILRNIPLSGALGNWGARLLVSKKFADEQLEGRTLPQLDPNNWPGTILARLYDWRTKLEWISGPIRADEAGSSAKNPTGVDWSFIRDQVFEVSDDSRLWNFLSSTESGVVDVRGNQIPRDVYERAVESIIQWLNQWKYFIKYFDMWMQRMIGLHDTDILRRLTINDKLMDRYQHNPRTKRFRNYHFAHAQQHIIKNGIIATKEQMANTVIIKFPEDIDYNSGYGGRVLLSSGTEWNSLEWMINSNIFPNEKKVRVITEINIEDYDKAVHAAFSNLAEAVRPMYRGELILRGDDLINPYDVVWVSDPYEQMYGPVEVERVITHFNIESGYTTTVIPQCMAIPRSRSSWIDALLNGMPMAMKALGIAGGVTAATTIAGGAVGTFAIPIPVAGTLIGTGIGFFGGAWASLKMGDFVLEEMGTGAGVWGNLTGKGRFGSMNTPVDIIPLVKNGRPWTAGLRGWGDENWQFRLLRRWADVKRGLKIAQPVIRDAYNQIQRIF